MKIITPTRRFSLQLTNEKWREPNENYYAHTPSLQLPNENGMSQMKIITPTRRHYSSLMKNEV
jgi:hypothetical protein